MKKIFYNSFDHIPDKNTNDNLLPSYFAETSNSDEYSYLKLALNVAIEECLDSQQQILIKNFYWHNMSKTKIAETFCVSHSTIVKRIQKAEKILQHQMNFALVLYKKQQSSNFNLLS